MNINIDKLVEDLYSKIDHLSEINKDSNKESVILFIKGIILNNIVSEDQDQKVRANKINNLLNKYQFKKDKIEPKKIYDIDE